MQQIINQQSELLQAASSTLKDIKKAYDAEVKRIREELMNDAKYNSNAMAAKNLKDKIKIEKEALADIEKEMQQQEMDTDDFQQAEEMIQDAETDFAEVKDGVINIVSRAAADNGLSAEVQITAKPEVKLIVFRG